MIGATALITSLWVPAECSSSREGHCPRRDPVCPLAPLAVLSVAAGVGTAAATALAAFLVETALAEGVSIGHAGWILAGSSISGIASRLAVDWYTDLAHRPAVTLVAWMMLLGSVGYAFLAMGGILGLLVGSLIAYSAGWGWMGILMYSVVQLHPSAPARSTGILQSGASAGSALGPLIFGATIANGTLDKAWRMAAVAVLVASGLVIVSQRLLAAHRQRAEER